MSLPILSGTARMIADPELHFAPSGTAVCKVRMAFNSRVRNKETNQWEDGDVFFIDGTVFNKEAENVAESLSKGSDVVVTGRVKTEQWQDKNTGEKRSKPSLMIDSIGPALKWATARPVKADRGGPGQQSGQGYAASQQQPSAQGYGQQAPAQRGLAQGTDDPWAQPASGYSDEAPF